MNTLYIFIYTYIIPDPAFLLFCILSYIYIYQDCVGKFSINSLYIETLKKINSHLLCV